MRLTGRHKNTQFKFWFPQLAEILRDARRPFLFLLLLIILFSCEQKKDYLIKIGDRTVSVEEFEYLYQFNPNLAGIRDNKTAANDVLATIIAQKLVAQEVDKQREAMPDDYQLRMAQYQREAVIEAVWETQIAPKARISEAELEQAYRFSKVEKQIEYILLQDGASAARARKMADDGIAFEHIARTFGYEENMIPTDSIRYGGNLPEIENAVIPLKRGEVSRPIQIGSYFMLARVTGEQINVVTSASDFEQSRKRLTKILRKRKMQDTFREYIAENLQSRRYKLDRDIFKKIVQIIEAQMTFDPGKSKMQQRKELSNRFTAGMELGDISDAAVVTFADGSTWTARQLLEQMKYAPYPISRNTPGAFRQSMIAATRSILDDELLYRHGVEKGLEKSDYVLVQTQMWRDQMLYKSGIRALLKMEAKTSDTTSVNWMRDSVLKYVTDIIPDYRIDFNQAAADTLDLNRSDMMVFKTHFPMRSIAPMLQPLHNSGKLQEAVFVPAHIEPLH
jgi:hypothetical protein